MNLGLEVSKGLIAKFVQAIFGFVGALIFARVLGPTGFGGFYLLVSLVEITKRPISGVSSAVRKRYAETGTPRRELIGTQLGFNLVFLLLVTVGAVIFRPTLISYTGLDAAPWLFILLFTAVSNFPSYQNLLASIGLLSVQTWIDTVRSVLTLPLQLLFVLAGYGAAGMAFGLAAATFLLFPITHYYLRVLPNIPTKGTLRSIWSFARYSIPSTFVGKAYDRFDVLLLGFLAAPAAAGQYEVAYKLTLPTMFIAGLASSGLLAKVSNLSSKDQDVSQDISNTLAFSSLFALPIFFGALALPRTTVVTTFGPSYKPAAWLLVGLALYRIFQTQTDVFVNVVNGIDAPEYEFRVSTIALTINIPLGVLLYFQAGPLGVVIATVIAEIVRYVLLARVVTAQTDATILPRTLIKQIISGIVMFAVVSVVDQQIAVQSWVDFSILLAVGAGVYFAVLTSVSRHFRITARDIISQAISDVNLNARSFK